MTDCEKIADIIKNYRYSELHRNFDAAHVARWAGQFSDESRDTILRETYSILSDWYYSIERIEKDFLNGMVFNVIDDIYKKAVRILTKFLMRRPFCVFRSMVRVR